MWPELVVIIPEGLDQFPGVLEVDQLVFVEAFVAELAVEAFDVAVLGGFAWGDEAMRRLEEMESGKVKGIPGEQVMAEIRKIVGLP